MNIKVTEMNAKTRNVCFWHVEMKEARSIGEAFWLWHCGGCYDCVCGESVGTEDTYGTDKWLETLDSWCIKWAHSNRDDIIAYGGDENWIIDIEEE